MVVIWQQKEVELTKVNIKFPANPPIIYKLWLVNNIFIWESNY